MVVLELQLGGNLTVIGSKGKGLDPDETFAGVGPETLAKAIAASLIAGRVYLKPMTSSAGSAMLNLSGRVLIAKP